MTANNKPSSWKKQFFLFWISQGFSLFGSTLVQFALVWWLTKTTGSASILATATAFAIIPEIIVNPIAGVVVDRSNRKKVMMLADSAIALATILLAVMFYFGVVEIWHVYVLMSIRSIGGAFHYPAQQASVTMMVPNEHLARVAGLNQALQGSVNIIAPPLGALLLELLDIQGTLSIDFLTAFAAVVILSFLHVPQPEKKTESSSFQFGSLFTEMKEGLTYLLHWKGLVALIILALVFKLALSPAFSLYSLLVNKHFNGDAAQYALVESISGIGVVLGGLVLGIWGGFKKKIYTLWCAVGIMGICLIWISRLAPSQFVIFNVATFILSLVLPMIDGPFMAILQSNVSHEYQGRVFSLTSSLLWLSTPLGLAIAGPVSDRFGITFWFLLAGLLTLLATLVGLFLPQVREIEKIS